MLEADVDIYLFTSVRWQGGCGQEEREEIVPFDVLELQAMRNWHHHRMELIYLARQGALVPGLAGRDPPLVRVFCLVKFVGVVHRLGVEGSFSSRRAYTCQGRRFPFGGIHCWAGF